jgi:hypothetical protein
MVNSPSIFETSRPDFRVSLTAHDSTGILTESVSIATSRILSVMDAEKESVYERTDLRLLKTPG